MKLMKSFATAVAAVAMLAGTVIAGGHSERYIMVTHGEGKTRSGLWCKKVVRMLLKR